MIDFSSDDAELERLLEARAADRGRERLERFDRAVLAWIVLLPTWTEELARACEFPARIPEIWNELTAAGFLTHADRGSKRSFWMPDAARQQARAWLTAERDSTSFGGGAFFDEAARRIAAGVRVVEHGGRAPVDAPLLRWAELAERGEAGPAYLRTRVRDAIDRGEAGDALGWLESARYLDGLVRTPYRAAITLSERRIELVYRLGQDRHHLESFLARPEQIAVIERLLAPDSPCWALHLLGMGGVGKTMLLRHVTVTQADQQRSIVARVDFDHLNPDFPVRRPGQLLAALAEGLASQLDGGRQQSLLISFHGYLAEINEQLSAEPPPDDPLDNLRREGFARILDAFASLVASLGRPPLFILDTCEELAKIDPVSAMIPSVEATFYILERLHKLVPGLRVLLAGRRLLAKGGAGWAVDPERLSREARRLPEARDYLALHVLRGFTAGEVDAYLAAQHVTLTAAARAALLAQCPDAGGLPGLSSRDDHDDARRYNPFDIALYAGWIQGDPELDLATLARSDTDPYIERRILQRLENDDLRAAMPALTLLRRFDRSALALLFPGDQERIDRLYRQLGEQEWTDYQSDGSGGALEINRALLPRITAYFEHPARRSALHAVGTSLGPALAAWIRATRLEDCRIEMIDAALRSMSAPEAAALWADLEQRIALGRAFSWAVRVAARLLGEGAALREGPLRVAIQATHTSAITHEQPTLDLRTTWEEIDRNALAHPDDPRTPSLHARAVAGEIAAARVTRKAPSPERLDELIRLLGAAPPEDDFLATQRLAAFVAAIDAALDAGATLSAEALAPLFDRHRLARPPLAAFITLLEARAAADLEHRDRATALFEAALRLAVAHHAERDEAGYLDWSPPGNLADRIRLEHECSVVAPRRTDVELRCHLSDAGARLDGIDAERWAAAMLLRRLARGLVGVDIVNDVLLYEFYNAARVPTCRAHRTTPPLVVAAAHAIAAAGDPQRALALLDDCVAAATDAGHDKPTIVAAQLAKLAVMQRYRIDPGAFAVRLLTEGADHERVAARQALLFTAGETGSLVPPGVNAGAVVQPMAPIAADLAPWLGLGSAPQRAASDQPRALAEQMLVNAEHLALLDPTEGGLPLGWASSAFIHCGDPVGALIAGIATKLAVFRMGSAQDVARVLPELVRGSYFEVGKLIGESVFPDYEALEKTDLHAGAAAIETAPVVWREWLFRLVVCVHVARPRRRGATEDAVLVAALKARYGAGIPAELRFPQVEIPYGPMNTAEAEGDEGEHAKPGPSGSRLQTWTVNGIAGLFILGVAGGVLYFAIWSRDQIITRFHWSPSVQLLVIGAVVVLSLLFGAGRREKLELAGELLRSVFFDLPRALLFGREAVIQVEASTRGRHSLTLRIERHTRFRGFPNGNLAVDRWSAELARPALGDTYASVSATLPEQLVAGVQVLERGFIAHRLVPIVVARSEAMLPWEAYLRKALLPSRTQSELWLYRPVPTSQRLPNEPRQRWTARVKVLHDLQDSWVETLWSTSSYGHDANDAPIYHVIGIPVRLSRGMQMRIGRDDPKGSIQPEDFSPAPFVVLQLPIVDSLVRASTDRQQVADLRELAFDAARSGAPFVLVLPALTREDAVLLITTLAKRLAEKEPSLDRLLAITESLRALLLRPSDVRATELAELAFDITLFAGETGPLWGERTTE